MVVKLSKENEAIIITDLISLSSSHPQIFALVTLIPSGLP